MPPLDNPKREANNGWNPIETAPLDGVMVDLFCLRSWKPPMPYERATDMYWCKTHKCWRKMENLHFVDHFWKPAPADDPQRRHLIPTHWRHVPFGPNGEPL